MSRAFFYSLTVSARSTVRRSLGLSVFLFRSGLGHGGLLSFGIYRREIRDRGSNLYAPVTQRILCSSVHESEVRPRVSFVLQGPLVQRS